MTALEIGKRVADLCRQGKNLEAINTWYSENVVSSEAAPMPGMGQTQQGLQAVRGKTQWWLDNHEVHGGEVRGPFPHGDRFALLFKYDVTPKQTGKRMTIEEVGVYTVQNDKIAKEEFFYSMG